MIRFYVVAVAAFSLSACAGTNRFDGTTAPRASSAPIYQTPGAAQTGFAYPAAQNGPVTSGPVVSGPVVSGPVVSGPVTSSPLPPPGAAGQQQVSALPGSVAPTVDPLFSPQTSTPATTGTTSETQTLSGGASRVATLGERSSERAATGRSGAVSSRDGVVGGWTAREATGGSCKVTLSSSPALDLYRASASGCANKDLQKVTAWDYREGEVYLYQPGGTVAARMRVNDGASLSGSIARSGAGLAMSR